MQQADKIKTLFDNIAPKYDFMNNIISLGTHFLIKKSAVDKLKLVNGAKVLDLCCGTGDITNLLADKNETENVIGVDFSENMLELAKSKTTNKKVEYIYADCTNLPFEDNSFDTITMCFGLRNIENKDAVMEEIHRVLKPEGQFLHMDFGKENSPADFIFDKIVPAFAKIFYNKNKEAYQYLIESKKEFFTPEQLTEYLRSKRFKLSKNYKFLFSVISAQIYTKN